MNATIKKIKKASPKILKPDRRTQAKNSMNVQLFRERLEIKNMTRKGFVEKMRRLRFNWEISTIYRIVGGIRTVSVDEARAMCDVLGVKIEDLFPTLTSYDIEINNIDEKVEIVI